MVVFPQDAVNTGVKTHRVLAWGLSTQKIQGWGVKSGGNSMYVRCLKKPGKRRSGNPFPMKRFYQRRYHNHS